MIQFRKFINVTVHILYWVGVVSTAIAESLKPLAQ